MRSHRLGLLLWLSALLACGCTATREFPAPSLAPSTRLVDVESAPIVRVRRPLSNVLVLSGGGMNGAFPAGLLTGWSESGNRPQFDLVTGISAGALIAPFAFLGSEYDAVLQRGASLQAHDIYSLRMSLAIAWSDSLADSSPLWRYIETEVTPAVLDKIAKAHNEGRRLFIGTTNLDTKGLVVWDLGAIACSDDPNKLDLFRKLLLASCSVPGLLPPVPINIQINGKRFTELHVDGGVNVSLLLQPHMFGLDHSELTPASATHVDSERTVHVIVAGKLIPETSPVRRMWFDVFGASLGGLLQAQMESDLHRVYLMTRYTGSRFALAAIPPDMNRDRMNFMAFDTEVMQQFFETGRSIGRKGGCWMRSPPGIDPREWQMPRRGVRLLTMQASMPNGP